MFTRSMILTLAFAVAATTGFGNIVAPKAAEARDTGKILAGLAAGAIVYGLIDQSERSKRVQPQSRGYYDGNRGSWTAPRSQPRYRPAPQPRYQPPSRAPRYETPRRTYQRGYDHGHRVGYDRGYDRGYDHGFRDGYDYGRRTPWGY